MGLCVTLKEKSSSCMGVKRKRESMWSNQIDALRWDQEVGLLGLSKKILINLEITTKKDVIKPGG